MLCVSSSSELAALQFQGKGLIFELVHQPKVLVPFQCFLTFGLGFGGSWLLNSKFEILCLFQAYWDLD